VKELLDESTITLRADGASALCNVSCLYDSFFGIRQLNPESESSREELTDEIVVRRKNARMNITVRGLPEEAEADDYYFVIALNDKGYSFTGQPLPGDTRLKAEATFNAHHDLISEHPFNLIHASASPDDHATVFLFRNGTDTPLAMTETDTDGNLIVPKSGKMLNILFNLDPNRDMGIYMVVTPWEEVHQWVDWY